MKKTGQPRTNTTAKRHLFSGNDTRIAFDGNALGYRHQFSPWRGNAEGSPHHVEKHVNPATGGQGFQLADQIGKWAVDDSHTQPIVKSRTTSESAIAIGLPHKGLSAPPLWVAEPRRDGNLCQSVRIDGRSNL